MANNLETTVGRKLEEIATKMVDQVDEEIQRLDNLRMDDLESLRADMQRKRKARFEQEKKWRDQGHGTYDELADEKGFFDAGKKSERLIVHFYRDVTERCKIVDHHLKMLAPQHLETKFCKINAEKSPFLTSRLQVRVLPSILLLKDNIVIDRIIGFTDLGNRDDFKTEMMEWRLAQKDVIEYEGDKENPPEHGKKQNRRTTKIIRSRAGRNIRGPETDSDDDDDDEEN